MSNVSIVNQHNGDTAMMRNPLSLCLVMLATVCVYTGRLDLTYK